MGVRNKKSNDLFFGIMQSPQATLPKETLLMDIILYLLQFIQYQHKQICWLLNFICRYIPLKQWAFDDSCTCPRCDAPKPFLYKNNCSKWQLLCKICNARFSPDESRFSAVKLRCPHCGNTLVPNSRHSGHWTYQRRCCFCTAPPIQTDDRTAQPHL